MSISINNLNPVPRNEGEVKEINEALIKLLPVHDLHHLITRLAGSALSKVSQSTSPLTDVPQDVCEAYERLKDVVTLIQIITPREVEMHRDKFYELLEKGERNWHKLAKLSTSTELNIMHVSRDILWNYLAQRLIEDIPTMEIRLVVSQHAEYTRKIDSIAPQIRRIHQPVEAVDSLRVNGNDFMKQVDACLALCSEVIAKVNAAIPCMNYLKPDMVSLLQKFPTQL